MHFHNYTNCSTSSDIICGNSSAFVQTGIQDECARYTKSMHIM